MSLLARILRTFDGDAHVHYYETVTAPPAADGVQGDWAVCLTADGLSVFGPKTDTWPDAAVNQGPAGPSGGLGVWASGTVYVVGDVTTTAGVLLTCTTGHTASADIRTDIALGYWTQLTVASRVESFDPTNINGSSGSASANRWSFYRVAGTGAVSKIGLDVITPSGNVALALYKGTGSGGTAAPGNLIATTGSVACPAAGWNDIALGATYGVLAGDWIALGVDNTTAQFRAGATVTAASSAWAGRVGYQNVGSLAAPSTAAIVVGANRSFYLRAS